MTQNQDDDEMKKVEAAIRAVVNKGIDFHEAQSEHFQGTDVQLIAIHAYLIRKTLKELHPGLWEATEKLLESIKWTAIEKEAANNGH